MKHFFKYILTACFLLTISCNDGFLDVDPVDRIPETDVFGSKEAIISHLGRLYYRAPMEDFNWPSEYAGFSLHTDEMVNNFESQNGYDPGNYNWWGDGYVAIRYINNFIEQISKSTVYTNKDEHNDVIGQAYWLRAYTYFALARRYGGVPILTEVPVLPDDPTELYIARSTEEQVFDLIISDLDFAIENLNDSPNAYVVNKGTALALKSRVSLYAASIAKYSAILYPGGTYMNGLLGIPQSKAEEYFIAAKNAAMQVIESNNYELYDYSGPAYEDKIENYGNLFFDESSNNKENILLRGYKYPERTHWFDVMVVPYSFRSGVGYSSRRCPTLDIVEKYEYVDNRDGSLQVNGNKLSENDPLIVDDMESFFTNKDPRFMHNILYPGSSWYDGTVEVFVNTIEGGEETGEFGKDGITQTEATSTGFYFSKWLQREPVRLINEGSDVDWPIIRYAEVLLDYAEANFELAQMGNSNGDMNEALKYVNLIRERAGIQTLDELTIEDIRNERLFEFYGEGQRYWDLKRWRIFHELLDNTETFAIWPTYDKDNDQFSVLKNQLPSDKFKKTFEPKNYYMEIPQGEIEKNPLLEQNFGY